MIWLFKIRCILFYSENRKIVIVAIVFSYEPDVPTRDETITIHWFIVVADQSWKFRIKNHAARGKRGRRWNTSENDVRPEIDESHEQPVCFDLSLFHRPADETNTYTRAHAFPLDHSVSMEEFYILCGIIYIDRQKLQWRQKWSIRRFIYYAIYTLID